MLLELQSFEDTYTHTNRFNISIYTNNLPDIVLSVYLEYIKS